MIAGKFGSTLYFLLSGFYRIDLMRLTLVDTQDADLFVYRVGPLEYERLGERVLAYKCMWAF